MSISDSEAKEREVVRLKEEVLKLKAALAKLIPCAGRPPEGPVWATDDAKARNRQMYEDALDEACACFPDKSIILPDGSSHCLSVRTKS
jgi:hypothetical protein